MLNTDERLQIQKDLEEKEFICHLERNFECKILCNEKPEVTIISNTGKILGVIKEPKTTFKTKTFIINDMENDIYSIEPDYFQLGVCWRNSLYGKCREVYFPIYSLNKQKKSEKSVENQKENIEKEKEGKTDKKEFTSTISNTERKKIGLITKKYSACANDNNLDYPEAIEIIFPDSCSYTDKFLIAMCGFIIDYRFYEIDPRDNEN